jgi:hypothetical protein
VLWGTHEGRKRVVGGALGGRRRAPESFGTWSDAFHLVRVLRVLPSPAWGGSTVVSSYNDVGVLSSPCRALARALARVGVFVLVCSRLCSLRFAISALFALSSDLFFRVSFPLISSFSFHLFP